MSQNYEERNPLKHYWTQRRFVVMLSPLPAPNTVKDDNAGSVVAIAC